MLITKGILVNAVLPRSTWTQVGRERHTPCADVGKQEVVPRRTLLPRILPAGGRLGVQIATTHAREQGLSQIIEHWLPWQGDSASTIRTENDWNLHNLTYLRSHAA